MKILILGGAGMLGHRVWLEFREQFGVQNVACTLRKEREHYDKYGSFFSGRVYDKIDALDFSSVARVLTDFKPDVVVNCIGITSRKEDMAEISKLFYINGVFPKHLQKWAQNNQARLIHVSTDCVFNGKQGPYLESDYATSEDVYGMSKFLGEVGEANCLTLRLSIIGRELEGKTELIEWFLSQRGGAVEGFTNVLYSGMSTIEVAKEISRLILHYPVLYGVYHVAGPIISKYELLLLVNEVFQSKVSIKESESQISNKVLIDKKYRRETGFSPKSWSQMIKELAEDRIVQYE